jgi:phosphate transport system substrate-binding protein
MRPLGILLLLALWPVLAGCGERPDTVRIDGSSTVFPIARAGLDAYIREFPDRRVVASSSGTGAGFQRFFRGETDVQNASRPIREDELRRSEAAGIQFIELPIAFDGLAIIANRSNDWLECLTVEQLRAVWERGSTLDRWSDLDPSFPDQPLRLYGRSPASGTFDYFTTAIMGQRGNIRDGYNASDTDNAIVQGVVRDRFGLAFFGLAYFEQNRDQLKLIGVDNQTGDGCVIPTAETIQEGRYQPLARPEFIYVNLARAGSPEVEPFVEYFISNGARFVRQAGYIPFSDDVYALVLERFRHRITGSMFAGGGPAVGVNLAALLSGMDRDEAAYEAASGAEAPAEPGPAPSEPVPADANR